MKKLPVIVKVNLKLLQDIYDLITESSKIDWEDEVTTRLYKVIKKAKKEKVKEERRFTPIKTRSDLAIFVGGKKICGK